MKLIKNILTQNDCYRAGRKITVKGLMLHSVGCNQPNASVFLKNWNRPGVAACVHGFIDGNTGVIYQTLPWNHRGWHGGGSSNNTHIGVEMCEPSQIKYTGGSSFKCSDKAAARKVAERTYRAAVELFAYLCKEYKLNPLTQIVSHAEGYRKGIATNHGDPEHLWRGLGMSYTMDGFRKDVKAAMAGGSSPSGGGSSNRTIYRVRKSWKDEKSQIGAFESLKNAKKACKAGYSVYDSNGKAVYSKPASSSGAKFPYVIKVTTDVLNVRKNADLQSAFVQTVKRGETYTIVDEKMADGYTWGKLKSGRGWIALKYTKKV